MKSYIFAFFAITFYSASFSPNLVTLTPKEIKNDLEQDEQHVESITEQFKNLYENNERLTIEHLELLKERSPDEQSILIQEICSGIKNSKFLKIIYLSAEDLNLFSEDLFITTVEAFSRNNTPDLKTLVIKPTDSDWINRINSNNGFKSYDSINPSDEDKLAFKIIRDRVRPLKSSHCLLLENITGFAKRAETDVVFFRKEPNTLRELCVNKLKTNNK